MANNSATGGLYSRAEGNKAVSHLYGAKTRAQFGLVQGDESSDLGSAQHHRVLMGAVDDVGDNATYTELFLDGPGGSKRLVVPDWSMMRVQGTIILREKRGLSIVETSGNWPKGLLFHLWILNTSVVMGAFANINYVNLYNEVNWEVSGWTGGETPPQSAEILIEMKHTLKLETDDTLKALRLYIKGERAGIALADLEITEIRYVNASGGSST